MTDLPPPVVQRGSAVLIRGAALPLYRATLVLIALGWSILRRLASLPRPLCP
jgi:hypothetical protein